MSKYKTICEQIRQKILDGIYAPNTYLPAESKLMEEYQASRDTIRRSLDLLSTQGLIQKENGKGSLVLENKTITFPVAGLTSFKELQQTTMNSGVKTIVSRFEIILPDCRLQKTLNITADQPVLHVQRIREIDGEKVILDDDYINTAVVPDMTIEHAQNSIFEYIENELNLNISFGRKEITFVPAGKEVKKLLDLKGSEMIACVKSYNYLDNAILFDYTESRHRPDKFRFIDFSRREKLKI